MSASPPRKKVRTCADDEDAHQTSSLRYSSQEVRVPQCADDGNSKQITTRDHGESARAYNGEEAEATSQKLNEPKEPVQMEKGALSKHECRHDLDKIEQERRVDLEESHREAVQLAYCHGLEDGETNGRRSEQLRFKSGFESLHSENEKLTQQLRQWADAYSKLEAEKQKLEEIQRLGIAYTQGLQQAVQQGNKSSQVIVHHHARRPVPPPVPKQKQTQVMGEPAICSGREGHPHIPVYCAKKPPTSTAETELVYRIGSIHQGRTVTAIAPACRRHNAGAKVAGSDFGMWVHVRKDTLVAYPEPSKNESYPNGDWGIDGKYYGFEPFDPRKVPTLATPHGVSSIKVMSEDAMAADEQAVSKQPLPAPVNEKPAPLSGQQPSSQRQTDPRLQLVYRIGSVERRATVRVVSEHAQGPPPPYAPTGGKWIWISNTHDLIKVSDWERTPWPKGDWSMYGDYYGDGS